MVKEGYKQTEIGVIPEDWYIISLSSFAIIKTGPFGSSLHAEDYVLEGTPIITVEHLGERSITAQNLPMVSNKDRNRLLAYTLNEGDIVFSRVGSVDRNAYITEKEDGWLFSGRLLRIRINTENYFPLFFSYYFKSENAKKRIKDIAVGQTMPSLNTKLLSDFITVIPTVGEQKHIAEALSDIDELISSLEKLIAKKKAIKQGAMQQLLTGKIRLPGYKKEWKTIQIKSLGKMMGGGTPSTKNADWWNGSIPWISSSDLSEEYNVPMKLDQQ